MVSEREMLICGCANAHTFSSANKIGDKGATALSEALMVNTSLHKLHISGLKTQNDTGTTK